MARLIEIMKVGKIRYNTSLKLQEYVLRLIRNRIDSCSHPSSAGILILTEHHPVYTIGIRSKEYNAEYGQHLRRLGADFHVTNRGGLITFHGPGQLVAYPIINLKQFEPSVRWYVSQLEDSVISTCSKFGLEACRSPHTGVWINDKKICAMGIHVRQHVTSHGLALNCNTDLKWFGYIVPCGIEDKGVTSLSVECGRNVSIEDATDVFVESFTNQFNCTTEILADNFVHNVMKNL